MSKLEDGRYRARARDAAYGYTSKNTEQVVVMFELETGDRRTWYGYLSDAAVDRTLETLQLLGVTDLETLAGIGTNEVEVVLRTETYEGRDTQKIAFVNPLGSGAVRLKSKMDDGAVKSFASRLKGKWLSLGGSAAPPPEPTPDDEIPF